ncbi:MAG: hypothetical protein QOI21_6113 [Actinomycetota bacterium]|jgi:NADPH:quinone reductase-like Zn-dependent oxidoreductase|nr:hypothetical protein [Actinomycetota bacterium]
MRAISQQRLGGPEVLELVELDRPVPAATEILVRVHAVSVNPTDWKSRSAGGLLGITGIQGRDVSGVVEEVGFGVQLFKPGDEVFGMARFPHPSGGYAEFLAAPSRHFAHKPEGLDHLHAAALPLAALTAWQSFVDTANLQPGQRVLVHAAAGGVGHLAVQIAKSLGAYVIGTASAAKHDFVRGLGADEVIDYRTTDFAEELRDLDVVLDPIGGDYRVRSLRTLRRGGHLIALTKPAEATLTDAVPLGINAGFTLYEPDNAGLLAIKQLVESGQLKVTIDTVFPLEEAAKAHELGEAGRTTGKIVLSVVP